MARWWKVASAGSRMISATLPASRFSLHLVVGLFAGLSVSLGDYLLVLRSPSARALRYFVALGAGFMLAAALLEMLPEAFSLNVHWAAPLILAGYCGVHLLEHTLVPHFHFGEETHHHEFLSPKSSYSVLLGLATHTFFDGIAIGSGFVVSAWLGWVLFIAVFLHKIPEGFTVASVMLAGGQGRGGALRAGSACIHPRGGRGQGRPAALGRRHHLCRRNRPGPRGEPRARRAHGARLLCRRRAVLSAADAGTGII